MLRMAIRYSALTTTGLGTGIAGAMTVMKSSLREPTIAQYAAAVFLEWTITVLGLATVSVSLITSSSGSFSSTRARVSL